MSYMILALNPGSTSTKIALYEDRAELFSANIDLEGLDYNSTDGDHNLLVLRSGVINSVEEHGYSMNDIDAFAGRGGAMASSPAGVYIVDEMILEANKAYKGGRVHACFYSPVLTYSLAQEFDKPAFILNAQSVDEFEMKSRFTGFPEIWRTSGIHALNHKEVGNRAAEKIGKKYDECSLIVAHLGGGISIAAHKKGKMVDFSGSSGAGPMCPTRSGMVPAADVIRMCFSGNYSEKDMLAKVSMNGGLLAHLGTGDGRIVEQMIADGDDFARETYDAMIYQICKDIGSMAVTMAGNVDAIVLTGGLSFSDYIVESVKKQTGWIADVISFPGEFEMEALGNGVLRVLEGSDEVQRYSGIPVFTPPARRI